MYGMYGTFPNCPCGTVLACFAVAMMRNVAGSSGFRRTADLCTHVKSRRLLAGCRPCERGRQVLM